MAIMRLNESLTASFAPADLPKPLVDLLKEFTRAQDMSKPRQLQGL